MTEKPYYDLTITMKKQLTYTRALKHLVASGRSFTTNKDLALDLGKELCRYPIEFISPNLRETYLKAWPELGMPPINGKSLD